MVVNNKKVNVVGVSADLLSDKDQTKLVTQLVEKHSNTKVLNVALINNNACVLFMDGSDLVFQLPYKPQLDQYKSVIVMDNISSYVIQFVQ
ncbi:MAG: hypothetical protein HUJ71_05110 [Pseudobutyrivibrio sp.]|nr:hypothetical protein [Pseudobutyrivibrio sp.]